MHVYSTFFLIAKVVSFCSVGHIHCGIILCRTLNVTMLKVFKEVEINGCGHCIQKKCDDYRMYERHINGW